MNTTLSKTIFAVPLVLMLGACVQMPTGPEVTVMPAPYKPFEVFTNDDQVCRQYAQSQIGGAAGASQDKAVGQAVATTALGAAAGALIGGNSRGAGVGAGAGLLVGAMSGGGDGERSTNSLQRHYDLAYQQCMYSKGNQVPGFALPAAVPPPPPNLAPPR